jgi:hypothetical protein
MGLIVAIKAFFRGFTDKQGMKAFLKQKKGESAVSEEGVQDPSHIQLLTLLQQSGRLIDFLKEDISQFDDALVGAAARKIHDECRDTLEEVVSIRPVLEDPEGKEIQIPTGYDPSEIKIFGNVSGEPPFKGVLRHRGWRAQKISLPKKGGESNREVICPAEVEIV